MLQAQVTGADQPLKLVKVPIHEAPREGLLIKTAYGGVCRSDLHMIDDAIDLGDGVRVHHSQVLASKNLQLEGSVLGHEISGTIVKFGADAKPEEHGLKEGDHVSIFTWIGCGDCDICHNDCSNHCPDERNGVEGGFGLNWMGCAGYNDGGYQEYVKIPSCKYALKLPDSVPLDVGAMIPCSGITAYSALSKAKPYVQIGLKRRSHARVMVYGVGGVGLWAVALAKAIFEGKSVDVIAADIGQDKLDTAKDAGADHGILLNRDDDVTATVTKIKGFSNMDVILDFVGSESSAQVSLSCLYHNGTYIPVGLAGGKLNFPLPGIIAKSLAVQGSLVGNITEHKELIELLSNHKVNIPNIEYHKLEECNTVIDNLRAGKIKGRALFKYD